MVFLGDIAFYMATLVLGIGVFLIHHLSHHTGKRDKILSYGAYLITGIAVLGMLCTGYYWTKYYFDGTYAHSNAKMGMMSGGMMGSGMMARMSGKGMRMGMMQNMQNCMSKMKGQMMDSKMMDEMQSCMMGKGMMHDGNSEK